MAGRVAVVTGSSRGIGKAVASNLAGAGARVVVNGRSEDEVRATEKELREAGGEVTGVALSVTSEDGPDRLVEAAADRYGPISYVVNVVAINPRMAPVLEVPREAFTKVMVANTWPAVATVQAAARHGLKTQGGAVVNVSTIGARQYQPRLAAYCASKAALEVVTIHQANELGPYGVSVNTVAPGLIQTDMARVLWEGEPGRFEEAVLPMRRLGQPQDVAGAITYLLSDEARWITGCTLSVDGGRLVTRLHPTTVP